MHSQEALKKKIEDLPFSEELKAILKNHGIYTLQELIDLPVYEWHRNIAGFNFHDQHEIVSYLNAHDLVRLIKED